MTTTQLYQCAHCPATRRLSESPTDGPQSVRAGCKRCGRLTSHYAVGRVEWVGRL